MNGENELIGEFDARKWAATFVATVKEIPGIPTDEETMVAWFASAIMAGYDRAKGWCVVTGDARPTAAEFTSDEIAAVKQALERRGIGGGVSPGLAVEVLEAIRTGGLSLRRPTPVPDRPDDEAAIEAVREATRGNIDRALAGYCYGCPHFLDAEQFVADLAEAGWRVERSRSGPDSATQGEDHEAGWRLAAKEVIARLTSETLLPSQRQALIALGDALRASPDSATEPDTAKLVEALREARLYVFNRTQGEDWRAETARDVLERVDAALGNRG